MTTTRITTVGQFVQNEWNCIYEQLQRHAPNDATAAKARLLTRLEGFLAHNAATKPQSDNERIATLEQALRDLIAVHDDAQPHGQYERYNAHLMGKAVSAAANIL